MSPFARLLKRTWEKLLGHWEEDIEPPARLLENVLQFATYYPKATRRQWVQFAAAFAGECWKAGYIRGYENSVRESGQIKQLVEESESLADALDKDWRDRIFDSSGIPE